MAREIYAYTGKILRVDLSSRQISTEPTIKYAREWLGGRGIGQRILYSELQPWITPFEPANRLIVETGPLCGTLAPGATRHSIASKNVFSHGVGTANSGGHFASELKFAGYDFIVFTGKASTPVYLWIDDDKVEVKDARGAWGKTTWDTDEFIKKEIGDENIQIMCIGPAGENLVKGACIITNRNRAAGRCGLGAVMGSKNLKAVAVRGTGSVEVAHPDRFMEAVNYSWEKLAKSRLAQTNAKYGTQTVFPGKNEMGSMPYKNFQDAHMPPESLQRVSPDVFLKGYIEKSMGYSACPIPCSHFYRVNQGPYAGLATEGIQAETLQDFAGKLAIDYAPAIVKAHALCNQLGLDLDNGSGPISWAFECYQRGIITQKDTDGLKLEWGDYGVVFELINKMARREGFGNILAEGCKHASEIIGRNSSYYAIHMKGQDLYEEVRLPIGWGLGVCVATRGGGHTTGSTAIEASAARSPELAEISKKIFGINNVAVDAYEDKPKLIQFTERFQEIMNSLGLCMHTGIWSSPTGMTFGELAELYSAATGWETTVDDLVRIADRILNLEKAFNGLHTTLRREDDYPPERCLKEPIKSGPYKGFALSKEKYDQMLDEYYRLHGWDPKTGLQTRRCLAALDLTDVAEDLRRAHKLIE